MTEREFMKNAYPCVFKDMCEAIHWGDGVDGFRPDKFYGYTADMQGLSAQAEWCVEHADRIAEHWDRMAETACRWMEFYEGICSLFITLEPFKTMKFALAAPVCGVHSVSLLYEGELAVFNDKGHRMGISTIEELERIVEAVKAERKHIVDAMADAVAGYRR